MTKESFVKLHKISLNTTWINLGDKLVDWEALSRCLSLSSCSSRYLVCLLLHHRWVGQGSLLSDSVFFSLASYLLHLLLALRRQSRYTSRHPRLLKILLNLTLRLSMLDRLWSSWLTWDVVHDKPIWLVSDARSIVACFNIVEVKEVSCILRKLRVHSGWLVLASCEVSRGMGLFYFSTRVARLSKIVVPVRRTAFVVKVNHVGTLILWLSCLFLFARWLAEI